MKENHKTDKRGLLELLAVRGELAPDSLAGEARIELRGKNQLFALCSCVGACQWLLDGRITAYCGTFKIWDMAGTLPVLANAAFSVVSLTDPGKKISLDLSDGDFSLEPGKDRWRIKTPVIIASEHSTVLSLYKNFYKLNP